MEERRGILCWLWEPGGGSPARCRREFGCCGGGGNLLLASAYAVCDVLSSEASCSTGPPGGNQVDGLPPV